MQLFINTLKINLNNSSKLISNMYTRRNSMQSDLNNVEISEETQDLTQNNSIH